MTEDEINAMPDSEAVNRLLTNRLHDGKPPMTAEEVLETARTEHNACVPGKEMTPSAYMQVSLIQALLQTHEKDCTRR